MTATRSPLVLTADQRDEILRILSGNYQKLFPCVRAGRLLRDFNHLLKFSIPAQALYVQLAGFMGADKSRRRDEVQVGVEVMTRWLGCGDRAVQKIIRELTLSGSLPLIQKRIPGGLGRTTVYAFVRNPFALADKQAATAPRGGRRNVSTRPRIVIVDNGYCLTPGQIEWYANQCDDQPKGGNEPESREFFALKRHVSGCQTCAALVAAVYEQWLPDVA